MTSDLSVVPAVPADTLQVFSCCRRNLPLFYSPDEFFHLITDSKFDVRVVKKDNIVVAFIAGRMDSTNYHILTFGVDVSYRRQGLGKKLIDSAIDGSNSKYTTMSLLVHVENQVAIDFYKKQGFEISEHLENYYHGAIKGAKYQDAYHMVWKIHKS